MLFQRLYNWIKYKTLPPSFLFKNRLFIERDSRHRRVFTNFGLTFRNAKWTNYELSNIKFNFKNNYIIYILKYLIIIFFIIIIFKFYNYYLFNTLFNQLFFIFWTNIDNLNYYFCFIGWTLSFCISFLIKLTYSYFFFNNFSNKEKFMKDYLLEPKFQFKNINFSLKHSIPNIELSEYKYFFYNWIQNTKFNSTVKNDIIEKIFHQNSIKNWNINYDFFNKLFKLKLILDHLNERNNLIFYSSIKSNLINKNNLIKYDEFLKSSLIKNKTIMNYSNLIFWYILTKKNNFFNIIESKTPSLKYINKKNSINLNFINYSSLINWNSGLFFIHNLSFNHLNNITLNFKEMKFFSNLLSSFEEQIKWQRWLYKYSILHRHILKNSTILSKIKKFYQNSFFDNQLFSHNLWASEHFTNNEVLLNQVKSLFFNNFYKRNNNKKNFINFNFEINENKNTFNLENSYFWFIKRFYIFNMLTNNKINFKYKIFNKKNNKYNNNIFKLSNSQNYLVKSININLLHLNNFFNCYSLSKFIFSLENSHFIIDSYLNFDDNEIFNKGNLNFFFLFNQNNFNYKNNFLYFNNLNYLNNFSEINFINNCSNTCKINNFVDYDIFFLNDIYLLFLKYELCNTKF